MDSTASPHSPFRFFLLLASIVLVVASLYFAQKVLIPVALAILLTFILSPAVAGLQRRGLGRLPSVILVVCLAFALLGGIGSVITLQVHSLAHEFPHYKDNIRNKIAGLRELGEEGSVIKNIQKTIQELTDEVLKSDRQGAGKAPEEPIPVQLQPSGYAWVESALTPAAEAVAMAGMVVVLVVFMLIQREDLRNRLVRLIGHGRLIVTTRAIDEAARRISRYLLMQVLINAGFGIALTVGLFFIGVPYALLWGFIGGIMRFIPFIGTWLAASLLLTFSVAVFPGWLELVLVVALFLGLELLAFNVLEPLLFGHSTGISPSALLVATAFWTWLWGPIGLILATPLTACLVVLGKFVPPLEFFSVLLGDEPALEAEVTYYQRILARDQDEATDLIEEYLQDKPVESVYDEVLIPALVLAKRDRERDELTREDEHFLYQVTRDILDDLLLREQQIKRIATDGVPAAASEPPRVLLVGCPARDEADELALHMFGQLLDPGDCQLEVLSAKTLIAEMIGHIKESTPAAVCVAALPPGGLAQTRYFCKRLRAQFPELKIVVGRWGLGESSDRILDRLKAAGADLVGTTLLETRRQLAPLIPVLAHTQEAAATARSA